MNDGKRKAQRSMFGIMNVLKPELETVGLNEEHVWEWVKGEHGVSSRSELDEQQLAIVSARLSAATRDQKLFLVLCEAVRTAVGTCRVYRGYADYTFKKVYDGVITSNIKERCQRQADATGCFVNLCGADSPDSRNDLNQRNMHPIRIAPRLLRIIQTDLARFLNSIGAVWKPRLLRSVFLTAPIWRGGDNGTLMSSGFDVIITDRMGHNVLMQFTATPAPRLPVLRI